MLYIIKRLLLCLYLFSFVVTFSCKNSNECEKYSDEVYPEINSNLPDSTRFQVMSYLSKINEPNIHESKFEAYRLSTNYALSNTSNSFLFRKNDSIIEMIFKEFEYDYSAEKMKVNKETKILLSDSDWEHVQYLIYKFNFWTEKEFESIDATDGYSYVLEGFRPQAKFCSKKTSKIILRINSRSNDNIIWLCDELISLYTHRDETTN